MLIRPLREEARLPKLPAIPLEGLKAPALACGSSRGNVGRPCFDAVFPEHLHRTFFGKPEQKNMVYRLPEV